MRAWLSILDPPAPEATAVPTRSAAAFELTSLERKHFAEQFRNQ